MAAEKSCKFKFAMQLQRKKGHSYQDDVKFQLQVQGIDIDLCNFLMKRQNGMLGLAQIFDIEVTDLEFLGSCVINA